MATRLMERERENHATVQAGEAAGLKRMEKKPLWFTFVMRPGGSSRSNNEWANVMLFLHLLGWLRQQPPPVSKMMSVTNLADMHFTSLRKKTACRWSG